MNTNECGYTHGLWLANHDDVCVGNFANVLATCHWDVSGGDVDGEANASRIVACVNACEGVPQEAFDGGFTVAGMSKYTKQLEQQRDELLEALIHLEHNARKSGANMGLALDVAKAAIAKVKGGAA